MKTKKALAMTFVTLAALFTAKLASAKTFDFVLFKELADVKGINLIMLIAAAVLAVALIAAVIIIHKKDKTETVPAENEKKLSPTRALIFGALALSLSFVLSYIKLFEMPYGGSITLCSMLPIVLYASWCGPLYGFTVAFAYALLQIVQGAYIIHPVQFILDYILAFTVLGAASFFRTKRMIPVGILVAGALRLLCSIISGVVFFAEYAPAGMNVWVYSIIYNGLSLGVDAIICFIVYIIPPVNKAFDRLKAIMFAK